MSQMQRGAKGVHRARLLLALAGAAAGLGLLRASSGDVGFTVPDVAAVGRRGLLGAGLLLGTKPAHAAPVKPMLAVLEVDVEGEDGSKTEEVKIQLRPDWAPRGVRRFVDMVELGDLDGSAFHHVHKFHHVKTGGAAEFGLPAKPTLPMAEIKDDLVRASNTRGKVAFSEATHRVNTLMVHYGDNSHLDSLGHAPIGEVLDNGMETLDKLYDGYGSMPAVHEIEKTGSKYVNELFPKLAKIKSVRLEEVSM